jgi:hypothetical protein
MNYFNVAIVGDSCVDGRDSHEPARCGYHGDQHGRDEDPARRIHVDEGALRKVRGLCRAAGVCAVDN